MSIQTSQNRYDEGFKRKVIEEYLRTHCMKKYLMRKYQIAGKSTLQNWMKSLGYQDPHSRFPNGRRPKFDSTMLHSMPSKPSTQDQEALRVLQKTNEQLQRQLEEEKLRSEAYLRIIEMAEKELKISIRKKPSAK
jgi:transposase